MPENQYPRLLDCFTFFNEFDLLEIRLEYLYDTVDFFIIVEADETFTGAKKEFNFELNRERFKRFQDKIIFIPCSMPAFKTSKKVAWKREAYQRNAILDGLNRIHAKSDDVILMGDVDEIPNVEVLTSLKNNTPVSIKEKNGFNRAIEVIGCFIRLLPDLLRGRREELIRIRQLISSIKNLDAVPVLFRMDNFYYFLNNRERERNVWKGTLWIQYKALSDFTLNDLRELRRFPQRMIKGAGWHFSYLGGKEFIKHKIKSFSHQEFNVSEIVNDEYIDFCMKNGYSLFTYFRDKSIPPQFEMISIEELPQKLRKIITGYPHLIHS